MDNGSASGLGVSSVDVQTSAPGVPSIGESALSGYEYYVWFGLLAPAGTPDDVVQQLNQAVAEIFATEEVQDYLSQYAFEVKTGSSEEFTVFLDSELNKFSNLVQRIGLSN